MTTKSFSTFFALFFLLSSHFANALPGSWINQIRPLNDAVIVATPENADKPLLQAFALAKVSIWIEIYHLSNPNVVIALIEARKKGVEVVVIYDSASLKNTKYSNIQKQLTDSGVSVFPSSPLFSISHSKSFLIDQKILFVSTMNFITHFDTMRDFGLFTQDPDMIREWTLIFKTDLENSKNKTGLTPALSNPNLVVSPVNSEQKIIDLISIAQKSIRGMVENLGSKAVIQALSQARSRGVVVQLITPECDFAFDPLFNYPYLYQLSQAGVENRVMPVPYTHDTPYTHAKTLVIDSRLAFLGSENFSMNSLQKAREIGVVFSNPKAVGALESVISKDWSAAKPLPSTPPNNCPKMN